MKPLVIYHDRCTDGFGAAFAAWRKLGDGGHRNAAGFNIDMSTLLGFLR